MKLLGDLIHSFFFRSIELNKINTPEWKYPPVGVGAVGVCREPGALNPVFAPITLCTITMTLHTQPNPLLQVVQYLKKALFPQQMRLRTCRPMWNVYVSTQKNTVAQQPTAAAPTCTVLKPKIPVTRRHVIY